MDKHLIVMELDNVLLKNHKEVTEKSKRVLTDLALKGHKIVFTTSRPYGSIMRDQHKLLGFPSIVVASGGGSAYDSSGTILLNCHSNYTYFQEALKVGIPLLKAAIWAVGDTIYSYKEDANFEQILQNSLGDVIRLDEIPIGFKLDEAPSTAFCIPMPGKVHEFFSEMNNIDGISSAVYDNDHSVIEVQQDDISKKSTVEVILSTSGIDEDNIIVFAASEKELEMAKDVGHAFVMRNAPSYVKELFPSAIETEYTCDEDGVVNELIKYFKLEK